jgi:NitT/TauT family transport system ATP-binding protein
MEMGQPPPPAAAKTRGHILIDDVVKIYDPEGAAVMAVDHCSLEIEAGEICMIVGPSGCGKTTLLNAIAGFHEITAGRILLDGEVLCWPSPGRTASWFSRTGRCSRGRPTSRT